MVKSFIYDNWKEYLFGKNWMNTRKDVFSETSDSWNNKSGLQIDLE